MRRPHLTAAGPHDECGAAHNSAAGLSALGGGGAGGRVRALYGNRLVLYPPTPGPHPPEEKASANRFKIRRPAFNLGRGAGAAAVPTPSQDWAPGTSWGRMRVGDGGTGPRGHIAV